VPRLVRDRTTWLIYAQLGIYGYFLYGFGPVVPLLRDEQHTSRAVASLHSTALAAGATLGAALFPVLSRRLGRERLMWSSLAGVAICVGGLCLVRPLPATLIAVAAISTFGTMAIVGVVAALTEYHGEAGPAAISEANAAASGMGVIAPVVIGLAVSAGLGWRFGLAVVVGLIALLALIAATTRVRLPRGSAAGGAQRGRRLPRAYWTAWSLVASTAAVEVSLSLWAADVLRGHAGMSPGGASAAVASIIGGMFAGRLAGGWVAQRIAPVPLLLAALGVSALGFTVFWLATRGWLAVFGLIIMGLGNALHYPLAISMAIRAANGQADRAAAYASYAISAAYGLAPFLLGWVADSIGSHLAFLLLPLLLGCSAALALQLGRSPPSSSRGDLPVAEPAFP
jgi:MFS family permease